MTRQYDLIAIGTGMAATSAASKCRAAGWNVAIIDYQPFGGTCALRGCDPRKTIFSAFHVECPGMTRPRRWGFVQPGPSRYARRANPLGSLSFTPLQRD